MNKFRSHYFVKTIFILIVMALLQGCGSTFSGAGPTKRKILSKSSMDSGDYQLIELSVETISSYAKPPQEALSAHVSHPSIPELYLIAGDVVRVMISDSSGEGALFSPLVSGGTVFDRVRINAKGEISLPYVGTVKIAGLSLHKAEESIKEHVLSYAADPQVYISLVGDLGGSILVAGDVNKPGRYSTLDGPLTILDSINLAGGPKLEPYLADVVVRTGKNVKRINYQDLLNGLNAPVAPRAEIILERARKRFVAMGSVNKPGLHDFPSQAPSLLDALGSVEGLSEQKSDARGVFIFRLPEDIIYDKESARVISTQKPIVFHLDMREPTSIFLARLFLIQPDDAVYVTNAQVYEFQKMISPIVQVLVLGRAVENL